MCLQPGENLLWAGKDGTYDREAFGGRLRRVFLAGMILVAITACGFPLWIWFGMIYKGLTDPDLSFNL